MSRCFLDAVLAFAAAVMGLAVGGLAAQSYPNKIIHVVNPAQPGGNNDILFRLLSPKMGEILGWSLVIDYPAIRKTLIERGADPVGSTPEEHAAYIKSEIGKWRRVVKAAGIKPE